MNTEQNEEQVLDVESAHPGQVLKQAREAIGLSAQDVADRLRLRVSVILDLEENCCENKQIATFTRGYIRSYAKLVGLNADELICDYQAPPQTEESAQKMQSFSRKTRIDKHDSRVMSLTWVILTVVVGITTFWWWQNQQNDPLMSLSENTSIMAQVVGADDGNDNLSINAQVEQVTQPDVAQTDASVPSDTTVDTPVVENTSDDVIEEMAQVESTAQELVVEQAESSNNASSETSPNSETNGSALATVATNDVTTNGEALNKQPTLALSFDGDCWVDIRDASGKRLLTGIKSAGETVDLSGEAPFKIVLGAPSAVRLVYNGDNVDLSGYPSGRVARLSLPK
ncbi:cytoskeleton protein RodZ [Enterovibrio calviensis]|uniref:cytoskeleton protein RodZ n=1 Tax=Enterovibrio calviensis TaxID=91359 RepID=UPI000480AF04|nr:cytoskeleton protein RodZ [Enterovibrio calviensis]